jgi:hypothetical protein
MHKLLGQCMIPWGLVGLEGIPRGCAVLSLIYTILLLNVCTTYISGRILDRDNNLVSKYPLLVWASFGGSSCPAALIMQTSHVCI